MNNVQKILLIISVVHCVGCVNNDKPKFEELVDGLFVPRIITNYTTYGVRDGALTQAYITCLLYTSPSPRDATLSRMPSSA